MFINTHKKIDNSLCGKPLEISESKAVVSLDLTENMICDEYKLVHGGFVFGMADYAAMLLINEPNVVLGKSEFVFLKPVKAGEKIIAKAELIEVKGKKHIVKSSVYKNDDLCAEGTFICFVPEKHVLDK